MKPSARTFEDRPAVRVFEESRLCPGFPNYLITESGKVARIGSQGWLKPCVMKRGGYLAVSLWSRNKGSLRPVHVLVTIAFHGARPEGRQAAHYDGNKRNNHWSNLRWATRAENEADKVRHGTSNHGERNGQAKLTDEQVAAIRLQVRDGRRQSAVAAEFGISQSQVSNIVRGKRRHAS